MKTTYAYGRSTLPAPSITVTANAGSIQGNNTSFYFWVKGRNRSGHNNTSLPTTVTVGNNARVTINASTFTVLPYEDWHYITVYFSKTNDFTTSRALYTYRRWQADQLTVIPAVSINITADDVLNTSASIADASLLPVAPPEGYRIFIVEKGYAYAFTSDASLVVDNVAVLPDKWQLCAAIYDVDTDAFKTLSQVVDALPAPLEDASVSPVPIEYYIINDGASAVQGYLELNSFASTSLDVEYRFQILGYINLTTFAFDTTGIPYSGVTVYENNLFVGKNLPVNSALVLAVYPFVLSPVIFSNTEVTLYPRLSNYAVSVPPSYFEEPVDTITELAALTAGEIIDGQSRVVRSKRGLYTYYANDSTPGNGNDVISPSTNPTVGRWMSASASVGTGVIGLSQLKTEVITALEDDTKVTTVTLPNSAPYVINLDLEFDYFIINCPADQGINLSLDISATLANNTTASCVVELRQDTAPIVFHSSIIFPGGNVPLLSGNGKTDMLVFTVIKDGAGTLRKRGTVSRLDIG